MTKEKTLTQLFHDYCGAGMSPQGRRARTMIWRKKRCLTCCLSRRSFASYRRSYKHGSSAAPEFVKLVLLLPDKRKEVLRKHGIGQQNNCSASRARGKGQSPCRLLPFDVRRNRIAGSYGQVFSSQKYTKECVQHERLQQEGLWRHLRH